MVLRSKPFLHACGIVVALFLGCPAGAAPVTGAPASTASVPAPAMPDSAAMRGLEIAPNDTLGLQLDDVLRRTAKRNPSIAAARAAWQEAQARASQAGALENPTVDLMAAPRSFGSSDVDPAYRVALTQPFPIFGQRGLRGNAATSEGRALEYDLHAVQLDLLRDARMAYFDYWRIARAIDLTQEILPLMEEFRRATLAKYGAGIVGQQDPLQADAEIAMLDHQLVMLQREREITAARLNVLMHDPPEHDLPAPPRDLPIPDTSFVHADLAPRARALRPELRAADAIVEASKANLSLAERDRWPTTSFGFAYDRFWSEPDLRPSVGISLSLPINFGRLSDERDEARARLAGNEARRDIVADSVALQVEVAAARLHEQAHDLSISRDRLVPLAERTVRAARAGYESNRSDFTTLISSVRDLFRAHLEADASFALLLQARADLDRALGESPPFLAEEKRK